MARRNLCLQSVLAFDSYIGYCMHYISDSGMSLVIHCVYPDYWLLRREGCNKSSVHLTFASFQVIGVAEPLVNA